MGTVRSAFDTASRMVGKVNPRYDMRARDVRDIYEKSQDMFDAICKSFKFGYAQGEKAARAEMRREKK